MLLMCSAKFSTQAHVFKNGLWFGVSKFSLPEAGFQKYCLPPRPSLYTLQSPE